MTPCLAERARQALDARDALADRERVRAAALAETPAGAPAVELLVAAPAGVPAPLLETLAHHGLTAREIHAATDCWRVLAVV